MPSPFPGMDPYLEDPWLWRDVHHGLISACQELLNRHLRPKYVARVQERVYLEKDDDPARKELYVVPDIRIAKRPGGRKGKGLPFPGGGTAVAEAVPVVYEADLEIREARIEVTATDDRTVVAVIEVVSPSNKLRGSEGRESFRQKRQEVLRSPAHWVEIDLLRAGQPTFPRPGSVRPDYAVHVSPTHLRPLGRVWMVDLPDPLPAVGVPLREPDPDVSLDLQSVIEAVYEDGAFDRGIDYRGEPTPPLPPDLAGWADELLRGRGLR